MRHPVWLAAVPAVREPLTPMAGSPSYLCALPESANGGQSTVDLVGRVVDVRREAVKELHSQPQAGEW